MALQDPIAGVSHDNHGSILICFGYKMSFDRPFFKSPTFLFGGGPKFKSRHVERPKTWGYQAQNLNQKWTIAGGDTSSSSSEVFSS
jgi:hypothetical protein